MASDYYTFDIFKPLTIILSVLLLYLWLLVITLLISSNLWPLFCLSFFYIYASGYYTFDIFKPLAIILSVFLLYLWLLITTLLISSNHYFVCLSIILSVLSFIFMTSDYYTFDIFKPLAIILSVFLLYL